MKNANAKLEHDIKESKSKSDSQEKDMMRQLDMVRTFQQDLDK